MFVPVPCRPKFPTLSFLYFSILESDTCQRTEDFVVVIDDIINNFPPIYRFYQPEFNHQF